MSAEEQDAVLGRMLREHGEPKKKLVALHAEAERIGNLFTALGHALRTSHDLHASGFASHGHVDLALLPDQATIKQLVEQIAQVESRKKHLASQLLGAGYNLKD